MNLDELIKYCEEVAETNKGIAERYKEIRPYEDGWDFWEKESKRSYEIVDWLKVLKNIMDVGSCNECKSRGMCEYEPEAGQMARFNCPFYKEERIINMTKINEQMEFPETFERFAKEYGFKDNKEVYTNGSDLIPVFRVKQWLEHQMTAEEYRQRMIQAFHNTDCDELIAVCVLPTEKEFKHLEWLLKSHYKKEPCEQTGGEDA